MTRTILACLPKLALISEFGEEMKEIRIPLMRHIQDKVIDVALNEISAENRPRVLPADPGFVYDVRLKEFVDWDHIEWKPIAKIGFGRSADDSAGAVGYFESPKKSNTVSTLASNAIVNFTKCLHKRGGHLIETDEQQ